MPILICLILIALAQISGTKALAAGNMELLKGPMTVTVVRGGGSKCEPLCPEWIALEGQITAKTPALFQKVLNDLGEVKLPVLIDSLGGDMDAAIKMGTLIHDRELTVAISSTGYVNCDPRTQYCAKGGKPDGIYKGFAVYSGYCLSTCILVWVGSKQRLSGGAMGVASDHPRTFSKKKPEKKIIAQIEQYLAKTIGNFVVLELMKKATESAPYPYLFTPEILQEASIVTSNDWADVLVDRKLCEGAAPAGNCVRAE